MGRLRNGKEREGEGWDGEACSRMDAFEPQ